MLSLQNASHCRIPEESRQHLVPPQKQRRGSMTGGDGDGGGDARQKKRRRVAGSEGAMPMPSLPHRLKASETALRIDVIRLVHGRSRSRRIRLPFNGPSASMRQTGTGTSTGVITDAMCRITVSMKDGGRVLHCHGHRCAIETSKDPYGRYPLLRIQLDDPYLVDWGTLTDHEHLCRPPGLEDTGKLYMVTVEVESSASSAVWPPLKARDLVAVDKALEPSLLYADGLCSHLRVDRPKGPPSVAFRCPHWRLESVFAGFSRPLTAPLLLKHFSGKGDLVHRTDYETRIMGGTA